MKRLLFILLLSILYGQCYDSDNRTNGDTYCDGETETIYQGTVRSKCYQCIEDEWILVKCKEK